MPLTAPAVNGDEERYPDRRASFSKTLPQNDLGEVEPDAYRQWLAILASGDSAQFDRVPRDHQAKERLNDPQATYATDEGGRDPAVAVTLVVARVFDGLAFEREADD